ncbi:MAG: hypothetical protein LC808_31505, partial [Actinobacteria bacterium]|nr:hypothetical protein [Actinomycetota bacterium]
ATDLHPLAHPATVASPPSGVVDPPNERRIVVRALGGMGTDLRFRENSQVGGPHAPFPAQLAI